MESVQISPKKCKIAMALAGHHTNVLATLQDIRTSFCPLIRRRTMQMV